MRRVVVAVGLLAAVPASATTTQAQRAADQCWARARWALPTEGAVVPRTVSPVLLVDVIGLEPRCATDVFTSPVRVPYTSTCSGNGLRLRFEEPLPEGTTALENAFGLGSLLGESEMGIPVVGTTFEVAGEATPADLGADVALQVTVWDGRLTSVTALASGGAAFADVALVDSEGTPFTVTVPIGERFDLQAPENLTACGHLKAPRLEAGPVEGTVVLSDVAGDVGPEVGVAAEAVEERPPGTCGCGVGGAAPVRGSSLPGVVVMGAALALRRGRTHGALRAR